MPDITPNQKAELDKNIRLMISNGASNEDVVRYSNDYREFLKKKESSSIKSQDGGIVGTSGRPLVYANVGEKPIIGLTTPKEKTGNGLEGIRVIEDKTPLPQLPKEYGQEVIIDEKDPIKSYRSQLSSKQDQSLAKLIQRERQPKAESTAVPPSLKVAEIKREEKAAEKKEEKLLSPIEVDKKVAEAKKVYSEDQNASAVHLSQVTGLSPAAILNTSKEQLQKYIRPGNETDELAVQAVSEARDVKDILGKATSLEEASAYFAGLKDPQIQEQINRNLIPGTNKVSDVRTILKEGSIGAKMVDFLFNPIVEKEIKNNPALYKEYKATVPVLINKYPEYGKYYVGSKISQKMEEMGINNALVNVVSKEESDKAVDELQKEGKMTQNEVQFYKDNLRDEGGYSNFLRSLVGKQYYTTPGVIENILGGAVKGSMNIATGASELLGLPELVRGKTEINARDISDRDLKFNIAPKGIAHEISMSGGEVIGNLAPFLFGGGEVLAAKTALSPTVANGLLFGLQTYGNNIAEARRLFPGSQVKQRAFATTQSLIDAVLLEKLGSNKIVKALSGEMKPAIENIVNGYATKSLSKEAVQNGIKDAFVSAVKKVPEAASHFVRQTGKNTLIMTGLDLAHQINEGVFEGKPVKDLINGQRVFEGARSAAIGSTFLSLLGTAAAMQNKGVTSKLIYQNAEQPDVWEAEIKRVGEQNGESQADIQDKIDNARYASSVYQDLKGDANMTEKQKAKYLLNSLIQRAKTREAEAITDPVLKQRATAEAKKIQEDQEALLDNKDDGTIEGDVSDVIEGENLIEKKRQQEAEAPYEIKLDIPEKSPFARGKEEEAPLPAEEPKTITYDGQEYANTKRIKQLIEKADQLTKNIPPVEEGYVRLWRGNRKGEVGENPQFTNSLVGIALPFSEQYNGSISYVDVLKSDLPKYEQKVGVSKGNEFIVTPDIAKKAIEIKTEAPLPAEEKITEEVKTPEEEKIVEKVGEVVPEPLKDVESTAKALGKVDEAKKENLEQAFGVLYHGTEADFDKFEKFGEKIPSLGLGYYFTPTLEKAKQYGSKIKRIALENAKILDWNKLSNVEREQIKKRLEDRIPLNILNGLGERKEKKFSKEQKEEANKFYEIKRKETEGYEYERGKARVKRDGENFIITWNEKGLESLNDEELLNLAQRYDNNIANEIGYDGAKYGNEIVIFDNQKIINATNDVISEAYHKAKEDGSNPKLVKAVEDLLGGEVKEEPSLPLTEEVVKEVGEVPEVKPKESQYKREEFPEVQMRVDTPVTQKLVNYLADVLGVPKINITDGKYISWIREQTFDFKDLPGGENLAGLEFSLNSPKQAFDRITKFAELSASERAKFSSVMPKLPVAEEIKTEREVEPEATEHEVKNAQTIETDMLLGGQAAQNRKQGKYVKDGVEYVRNEKGLGEKSGTGGDVRFSNEVAVPFKYKLIESETLQPSHQDGRRNPNHFIPEAQPKNRNDIGSLQAEESFADKPRFEELGENTNAYSGAPIVNERNEVVQGNNRAAGLRKGYARGNEAYKQQLIENAEKFGFTKEQVENMKNPVLVREVAVSDEGAIELGNYDAKDLETGGKRRLDPIAITRRMPFDVKGRISELLFKGEETLNQAIRSNQKRLLELLNPFLNQAQRNTITKEGVLTDAGIKDLEDVVKQFLFDNGDTALPDLYESLSATQKEGLRKALPYLFSVSPEKSIIPDVQEAIIAVNRFNESGAGDFDSWLVQGDMFNEGRTPKDIYTPLELEIARTLVESKTQKEIAKKFGDYAEVVKDKEADMFEPARPGKTRDEGVSEIFKVKYNAKPISERGGKEIIPEKEYATKPSIEKPKPTIPATEQKAGDVLRKAAEFTRSGKISKLGGFRAGIGFDIVWDRSLEVIAKALDGGATIADAIEAGLKYVKGTGWYKKLQDPSVFDKKYREHLKSEYNAVQEPSAGEVLQRPQEGVGEAGGKRGGVEQGVKGPEVTKEGKVEGEEREEVKPPVPPTTKEKAVEPTEEPENWSSIRKAKLSEIDSVREMYENKTKKAWSQTYQSGLENVQKMFPDKSLYEAMQSRVAEIQKRMERGELYNPTSEDLAVFNVLNAETAKRIKAVRGLDSSDAIEREMAIAELENLENQQMAIAKVVNPTEAGRAFSIRQAEMMLDENNGLKIRRMQLQKAKGGEPLTEEEEAFVNKHWEQEKALLLEEQQVREEQMKAEFDAKIDELQKQYEEKLKKVGKTPEARTKKAKTLGQSGKAVADQIRKLKINKKGTANLDFTLGTWDLAVEGIAQLVEKGATIAEAIDTLIKENKIGFKNKEDRDKFEDSLVDKLGQKNREEQVDKIKQFAEENGANDLTNEMVAKNLIKDYFNSLIGEYPKEQIFDEALKELKQILPNITKEGLREAFLKKGDFKQQSKKQLENSIQSQERELKKIAEKELTADQRNKIRLQQEKEKLERRRDEYKRKIANNEYQESEPPTKVKKYDAELIRIKKEAARVNNEFRQKEKQFKEKNKGAIEKGAEFVKDAMLAILIGAPKTMLKVGAMSIVRPAAETVRKLTIGKLFDHLFPNISKAAQRGGESSNVKTIAKGFEAYFRQMNEKQLDKKYEVANEEYDKAKAAYEDYKDSGSPDAKKLEKLKKAYQEKLVKAQSYFIYKFIGGSSIKDSLQALINRSNEIEKQFGKVSTETIKEEELLKKAAYIIGFIGRSHSAFKTFSGRYSFASSFMARLQGAVDAGEDISNPDKILEIAHESYLDWERGKYQQSNAISDAWASFINRRAENQENKGRGAAAKAFRLMMGADVAVTRVPVNILHEGLVEYTFGAFKAINDVLKVNKQMRQELKEAGITNGEKVLGELTEGTSKEEFRKSLKEKISQMDGEQAATIMRCFTKGGVGLGLYAFALIYGGIKFGIFPHKGEKKKKEEWELAPHELNPGEVVVGDKRLSETASGIIEHIPALFPMFMGLGLAQRYKDNVEEGQTSKEAAAESIYKHLEILQSDVPQIAFFDPLGRVKTTLRIGERRLEEYGLLPEDKVLPKVKDPESGMKRDMTETEGKSYEETLPVNFKEIIEDYRDSDKTIYFDVNGNIVLSKRDYPKKDRSSLESKDYSELSDVEIKKLYKKLKTVAKTKTLKELELEEVEEK